MLAAGAHLTHVRLQDFPESAAQLATTYVRVAEDATYDSFVLAAGAGLSRNEIHATLAGPRATCHLNGAQLLNGMRHADTTTAIDHAAPHCASRQTYKSVLAGRSRAVFQGRIHVHQVAQKTDGYQMNQALLLSPDAEMDSKPQLEIYADDVKCSHGATVGELDEGALFYLRSRGIPADEARSLLVHAFLVDALELVSDATLRDVLSAATERWWRKVAV
jgi:Fe-S cluster assembly protein SufD